MFKKLCGEESFASVALVTTFWEDVIPKVGENREAELKTTEEFYGAMLRRGSVMLRHENSENSARSVISYLVNRGTTTVLLDETAAGAALEKDMVEQRALFNKRLEESAKMMQDALNANDQRRAAELAEQQREFKRRMDDAQRSRDELRVNMEKLFQEKEEQFKTIQVQLAQERDERQKAVNARANDVLELQQALKGAEELFEERRKAGAEELARVKEQNQTLEDGMALNRQIEERNKQMTENLLAAKMEDDKLRAKLFETQEQMAELIAKQAQQPQNYQGSPPDYHAVLQTIQQETQQLQESGSSDSIAEEIAAGVTGAALGMAAAAPLALLCAVM
jgi:hypothetical protein